MIQYNRTLLSAGILAAFTLASAAHAGAPAEAAAPEDAAQDAGAPGDRAPGQEMETIVVHGIRESLKRSLETKRDADAIVDAITAEDIGKFPNTNVAEAMVTIPGVSIDRRFGQGERVSIDGTDPSLNLSFIDGHPVAQAIWLYGEQPNRGFDYTLLAPEILGRLEVYKSSEARLPDGSLGGTVMMHTRQPLDLEANTISGSIGYNYNDQAGSGRPTGSILYNWKNPEGTFGFNVAAQRYEEKVDRQGIEIFNYHKVAEYAEHSAALAAQVAAGELDPNALVPDEINAACFQQNAQARQRRGQPAVQAERRVRRDPQRHVDPRELRQLQPVGLQLHPLERRHDGGGRPSDAGRQRPRRRRTFVRAERRHHLRQPAAPVGSHHQGRRPAP